MPARWQLKIAKIAGIAKIAEIEIAIARVESMFLLPTAKFLHRRANCERLIAGFNGRDGQI
jgi:hypothetical protein